MTLKVYVDYASQPSRALPLFFKAAKIPHEVVFVHIVSQDHKSEKITKLNPFQTVPFVEHDGKVLGESMAILRYITKALDVEDHWYPKVKTYHLSVQMCITQKVSEFQDVMGEQKSTSIYIGNIWPLATTAPCTSR